MCGCKSCIFRHVGFSVDREETDCRRERPAMRKRNRKGERSLQKKQKTAEERKKQTEKASKEIATFETAEEFTELANAYFDECDKANRLYGEAGLCLYLTKHNRKGRTVKLEALHTWYDGDKAAYLQDAVQAAYLRIQEQIESDPAYMEKGMTTRAIFLSKQKRLGGYQDKVESKTETTVHIVHSDSVDAEDFK